MYRGRGDRGRGDRGRGGGGGGYGRGGGPAGRGGGPANRGRSGPPPPPQVYKGASEQGAPEPDKLLTKKEDEVTKAIKDARTSIDLSKLDLNDRLPLRPGFGSKGIPVSLWVNHFAIKLAATQIRRYGITTKPDVQGKKRARVVELALLNPSFQPLRNKIATDYSKFLITRDEVPRAVEIVYSDVMGPPPRNPERYQITFTLEGTYDTREYNNYLESTDPTATFGAQAEIIQAMNIIFGHPSKSSPRVASAGGNRYFPVRPEQSDRYNLGEGLEAIRGFFLSVRPSTLKCTLNVQLKHFAVFPAGSLLQAINPFLRSRDYIGLDQYLSGLRVVVDHLKPSRIKTITGLARPTDGSGRPHPSRVAKLGADAKNVSFWHDDKGRYITVRDYFREEYRMDPADDVPVIKFGRDRPTYLPAMVCKIVEGQACKRRLSPDQVAQMIKFAVRKPIDNAKSITKSSLSLAGVKSADNQIFTNFGINVATEMMTVLGRVLPCPSIVYRQSPVIPSQGAWNLRDTKLKLGTALKTWAVLYIAIDGKTDVFPGPDPMMAVVQNFHQTLRNSGVDAPAPLRPPMRASVNSANCQREINASFTKMAAKNVQFVLVILTNQDSHIYNAVKVEADINHGIHTVCVIGEKFKKAGPPYFANVALKVNLKFGGDNHTLQSGKLGIISEGKTMVVGLDVTHPSPDSKTKATKRDPVVAPSIAGMVASVDRNLSQWPATLKIQKPRTEMVQAISEMLIRHLDRWRKQNKNLPENILVYRDGVSEGQYQLVLENELTGLREACKKTYPADLTKRNLPRISIVIVGKRHNTRFYATTTDQKATDFKSWNPVNGTVVDRGVTEARHWEFFLQAHTALQGTARPAHYYVIHDEILRARPTPGFNNAAEALEELTHNMCYMYGRATKAVSIAPPAYYADLLCERARRYLSDIFAKTQDRESAPGSTAGSNTAGSNTAGPSSAERLPDAGRIRVHPNLENSMYYI